MIFNRFIIFFFYVFLISRFFSEKLKILPKWIDLINFPLFAIILVLLIININKKSKADDGESKFIINVFIIFSVSFIVSSIFNQYIIILPASILFYIGFMEGPILFIALNKMSKNIKKFLQNINSVFFIVLIINVIVVIFIDLPLFILDGNPDVISGTYGNNTYLFSMLLMICGGYLLGYNKINKYKTWIVVISQIIILLIFYLSQFRAGLPFFMLSYLMMTGYLYGRELIVKMVPIMLAFFLLLVIVLSLTEKSEKISALKYEDWGEIISEPQRYLDYGKFKIYESSFNMIADNPQVLLIGTGPGNFMSRANYTFTYELLSKKEGGVPFIIDLIFGIRYPYYSQMHTKYLRNVIKNEAVFGTWQFANPYTSYLAPFAEIGLGGISILILYIYIIIKSISFLKILKKRNSIYIPLAVSLIGGTTYLFGLAFLDNYWETARVTLPVWLLFWAVKTAVYDDSINDEQIFRHSGSSTINNEMTK